MFKMPDIITILPEYDKANEIASGLNNDPDETDFAYYVKGTDRGWVIEVKDLETGEFVGCL